jgi:valyl-tRNA synthetase
MRSALLNQTCHRDVFCDNVVFHGSCYDKFGDMVDFVHGNAVDPLPLIEKYGSDALRLALFDQYREQKTFVFDEKKISEYSAVTNKLWNACRYSFVNPYNGKNSESSLFS